MKKSTVFALIVSMLVTGVATGQTTPSSAEEPPAVTPLAAEPLADVPPAEAPPAEETSTEASPAEVPPAEVPPAEVPPAEGAAEAQAPEPAAEEPPGGTEPIVYDEVDVEEEAPKHQSVKSWLSAQPRKKKGAIKGALKGAAIGLGGALLFGKNPVKGVVAGAAAGALAGYLIGRRKDKIFAARDVAIAEIGYEPSQGYVMRIQEVRFDPPNLQPGETGTMYTKYVVVGPDPKEKIIVQAYTGLRYDESYLTGKGPDKTVVRRGGGIIETSVELTIPEEAPAGSYHVESMFDDPGGKFAESKQRSPVYVTAPEVEEAAETEESAT